MTLTLAMQVIVSFRGTFSKRDWLANLSCFRSRYCDADLIKDSGCSCAAALAGQEAGTSTCSSKYGIHRGFRCAEQYVWPAVHAVVSACMQSSDQGSDRDAGICVSGSSGREAHYSAGDASACGVSASGTRASGNRDDGLRYLVEVTGHSLGAALATLCAFKLRIHPAWCAQFTLTGKCKCVPDETRTFRIC